MRLEEFFIKWARGRGVTMADQLAREMRIIVGVQAPVRVGRGGRVYATTPAKPHAPPRRVSGNLQRKIRVIRTVRM